MIYRMPILIFILIAVCSGNVLASIGGQQNQQGSSLPALGASSASPSTTQQLNTQLGAQANQQVAPSQQVASSQQAAPVAAYTEQAPPVSQRQGLQSFNVNSAAQSSLYYQGTFLPWGQFNPGGSPLFWIESSIGWSWYASVPMGGWARELMYIPGGGPLNVYEIYPSGLTQSYNLGYASGGYNYIWFYGDVPGRHMTIFTVNDNPSNAVMVDVSFSPYGYSGYPSGSVYPSSSIGSSQSTGVTQVGSIGGYSSGPSSPNPIGSYSSGLSPSTINVGSPSGQNTGYSSSK